VPCVASLLQLLLAANDFIGISGYGSGYRLRQLSWRDMEIPLQTLAYELNFFGINLKEYTSKKPVIYVEQVGARALVIGAQRVLFTACRFCRASVVHGSGCCL
jgi:hypothetical protein